MPEVIANLLTARGHAVELTVRPERVGHGYTVEWQFLVFDRDTRTWHPVDEDQEDTRDE